jgi:polysaccharide biosynthesis/export protein
MKWIVAGALCALTGLAGCGVSYINSAVRENAGDVQVRQMDLTAQTVLIANAAPYVPRDLPAVFYQTTGGGGLPQATGLPDAPFLPDEQRGALELRIPPDPTTGPYTIGVGDVLLLSTQPSGDVAELSGLIAAQNQRQGYTVRDDGTISVPAIGSVQVEGMTVDEAEARLFEVFLDNALDPAFSLEVAEFNSKRVAIGGAVGLTALVPVALNRLTLVDALTAAGGVQVQDEQFASIRIYRDGTLYQIPFEDYLARSDLQNLTLVAGDAVYVDTTYNLDRALAFYQQQIDVISLRRSALDEERSLFTTREGLGAEDRDYIYLAGEVTSQSRLPMPFGQQVTLADMLYENGGFDVTTGNPSQIYVLRSSDNPADFGAVTAWHLDASNMVKMSLATRFEMRPNDIIFIAAQPITTWNRALQQFLPTLITSAAGAAS